NDTAAAGGWGAADTEDCVAGGGVTEEGEGREKGEVGGKTRVAAMKRYRSVNSITLCSVCECP
ncbi:MAG: hypothetical protein OEW06_12400, partial [Gemmatimonadota bacterium]|nr:hypothetical protein [Gemmatimonadota bacterium]